MPPVNHRATMTGHEIKHAFLNYFKQKQHTIVPSSSLVPAKDPTLLFTNAGMVQFKDVFIGQVKRPYPRAASTQKCVRAGGKHNDLENVGRTARHHTFFEMLGNFSFGDYFKQQAIEFGWELLTKDLRLPPDKLWITIYKDDDEAGRIWQESIGIPPERIVALGDEDNFWSMGDIGPCGPCSEIIIDQGEDLGCGRPDCQVGCECDRYLELWNLVFMQYERTPDGKLLALPKPSIDTGMGLERITAVVQGKGSNFDTNLFAPIIRSLEELSSVSYGDNGERDVSLRVIADHLRAIAFLISDGVMPANEGRGYVLRRIIRRASRHGRKLGLLKPYLYQMTGVVADIMGDSYPELLDRREFTASITQTEEQRFAYTLEQGLGLLEELMFEAKERGQASILGSEVFKLYDTYGFPLDLTQEILQEQGLAYNEADFKTAMQNQRDRSRSDASYLQVRIDLQYTSLYQKIRNEKGKTEFVGYDNIENRTNVLAILCNDKEVDKVSEGQETELVLDKTPFYAEKGGQVTDIGWIVGEDALFLVNDVQELVPGIVVHRGTLKRGKFVKGQQVTARINQEHRLAIALNHTATHLLHAGLRQVLGDHVRQAGSLVAPDRLRFDFTHFSAVNASELEQVESLVNEHIRANYPVMTHTVGLEQALQRGAIALFDEKYGDKVRLVEIDGVSRELCGGTHAKATGNIGLFKITSEASVAAGVRRLEALTGATAYKYVCQQGSELQQLAQLLKVSSAEVKSRVDRLTNITNQQEKQIRQLQQQLDKSQLDKLLAQKREIKGVNVISTSIDSMDIERLRNTADLLRNKLSPCVATVGSAQTGKVLLVTTVSKELTNKLHAGKIIQQIAQIVGGGGGGRPDMAQAGGKDADQLATALEEAYKIIGDML